MITDTKGEDNVTQQIQQFSLQGKNIKRMGRNKRGKIQHSTSKNKKGFSIEVAIAPKKLNYKPN